MSSFDGPQPLNREPIGRCGLGLIGIRREQPDRFTKTHDAIGKRLSEQRIVPGASAMIAPVAVIEPKVYDDGPGGEPVDFRRIFVEHVARGLIG